MTTPPSTAPERRPRILVAEDHPTNQHLLLALLAPLDAAITLTSNGAEALEVLGLVDFDAVLMDVRMPEMDGLEATRRLRASGGPNADVPVTALTANVAPEERRACFEAGMDSHIGKPIDRRKLLAWTVEAVRIRRNGTELLSACAG